MSGGLIGSDEEVTSSDLYPCSALSASSVLIGCAEEDNYIPQKRVQDTLSHLQMHHVKFDKVIVGGSDHVIHPEEQSLLRVYLHNVLHASDSRKNAKLGEGSRSHEKGDPYSYLAGYRGYLQSEALPGTIPLDQRMPRDVPYGLYFEYVNGTPFTAPRGLYFLWNCPFL
jgi:hypothetical protein